MVCYKCNQEGHCANECPNLKARVTCHKCGNIGHFTRDCKAPALLNNAMRVAGSFRTTQPRARTFNMTMNDAIKNADVVTRTLPINSINSKVLIDSGTTKSFISRELVHKLHCATQELNEALTIKLANQEMVYVNQVYP